MSFTYNLLPDGAVKFRENSADSVLFHLKEHTPSAPATMTITRTLPKPRKGNNGTVKVLINARRHVDIQVDGSEGTRSVPVICKLETSLPVGAEVEVLRSLFGDIKNFVATGVASIHDDVRNVFEIGLLPDGSGESPNLPGEEL